MLVRSSLKRLATSLYYPMSGKKTTQQWRKPIQQLKKQKQQATPIPGDADQKKKAAMRYYEKEYLTKHKQRPDGFAPKEKKAFNKKWQNQQQAESQQQSKPKTTEVNWLELTQIKQSQELSELVKEALKMSKLNSLPELKNVLSQVRLKFGQSQIEYLLNTLLKYNFNQTYDNFKDLGLKITKMSANFVNTVMFNFVHMEEYAKLQILLQDLKAAKFNIELKQEEFLESLFFKETSQQIPFEYGQNSVKISVHNRNFVRKLQIAYVYNKLGGKSEIKKRVKKVSVLPFWLSQSAKIVMQYRFGRKQFKKLLTNVIIHNTYLLPENFLQSGQFSRLMREFYFGSQDSLKVFISCVERLYSKNMKFSSFYHNFTQQLMLYRAQTGKPAFQVNQKLIELYKSGFESHRKYISIIACVIGADARYVDMAQHYIKSYMQGFPNQTLDSEDTKFVEAGILNNFNNLGGEHERLLTKKTKQGQNSMTRIKAAIKLGNLTLAYNLFEEQLYKKVAIERQKKNIEFVLRNQLSEKHLANYINIKDLNEFLLQLDDAYLWSLHKRTQDISVMLKNYIPQEKFSFWEEQQKKLFFQEISLKYSRGHLDKIKQPQSDIEANGFSLDQYLETQFPQLRQLQAQEYEKQKELIKYTLRIQGLIEFQKVHSDDTVIQKLTDFLAELSQQSLQVLQNFGLRDYKIKEWGWDEYVIRFNKMKEQSNMVKDDKVDWSSYSNFIEQKKAFTNKKIIEQMMIKTPELFKKAQALVKLDEDPIVNKILLWGVYTNEPMAVYLGQKLAMQTGQVIPHEIALLVSRMLSYRRPLSENFINRCKQCLKIVGKIDRQFIYLFDKEYEHILQRKNFVDFVTHNIQDRKHDNRELEDLIAVSPRQFLERNETRIYQESIVNRVL